MSHVYLRQFPVTMDLDDMEGDGRTVVGRIVPYGETISFVDPYDDNKVKRERFVPGALARQTRGTAWGRVGLSFQHEDGFQNAIGYGRSIQERDDGAYASFRLYEADAAKAREMIANSHNGLSLEFESRGRDETDSDGVIVRRSVHVRRVGITNDPAFRGARVLAVRESSVDLLAPDEPEVALTPYLDQARADLAALRALATDRLRRAGGLST